MEIQCSLGTTSKKKRLEDISSYYCDAKIFIRGIWRFPLAIFRTAGACVCCVRVCTHVCEHQTCMCQLFDHSSSALVLSLHTLPPSHAGGKISGIRKAKQVHMERLAVEISAGVVIPVERYYFSLPTGRAHTSHEVLEFPRPGGWG